MNISTNHRLFGFFILSALIISFSASAQSFLPSVSQVAKVAEPDSVKSEIKAIPLSNINNASTNSYSLITRAGEGQLTQKESTDIQLRVDSIVSKSTSFLSQYSQIDFDSLNFRELDMISNTMLQIQNQITSLQEQMNLRLQQIQSDMYALKINQQQWALTLEENEPQNTPGAIVRRINGIMNRNDSVYNLLENDIDFLLVQSDRATGVQLKLSKVNRNLDTYNKLSSSKVLRRDMPPVWGLFSANEKISIDVNWQKFKANFESERSLLDKEFTNRILLFLFVLILLIALVFWLRATVDDPEVKTKKVIINLYVNEIFQKPVEVALLLALYFLYIILPELPLAYNSLIALISAYAIMRIAYDILPQEYKRFLLGFAIAYILFRFNNLFYGQQFLSRLILLTAQITAIFYLFSFFQSRKKLYANKKNAFTIFLTYLSIFYLIFLILGVAGNLVGAVASAEYISGAVIKSGFLIIATYVGFRIVSALVYLVLASSLFRKSNIVNRQLDYILLKITGLFRTLFTLSWIYIALEQFKVREIVFEKLGVILNNEISIGQASLALINIILFVLVIWLSMIISKMVRHILQEEVFPRVEVERGMPGTITMLVRIALITLGFLFAAGVAGVEMSNLTIIIGAFSVGIGFGLQNIFNNLVSGLILAFERPIKEGDIVEVSALLGRVVKIGIRSSIVRTYDGAEVIVPNGELIANQLINWTLSDQFRRGDIRIGVAYGTDPQKVIDLLLDIVNNNPRVMPDPAPKAYFIGFGDSSLDFRLLAWIDQDFRLEVESEIRVSINARLKEAGIEIPFPQRDLHLRTISPDAGKIL